MEVNSLFVRWSSTSDEAAPIPAIEVKPTSDRFRVSREDSDFIIRIAASGLIPIETWNAHVYHYTCVSSRGKGWYKKDNEEIRLINEWQSAGDGEELKRFVRKWKNTYIDYKKNSLENLS